MPNKLQAVICNAFLFNSLYENVYYISITFGQCPLQKEPIDNFYNDAHRIESEKFTEKFTVSRKGFRSLQTKIKDFLRVEESWGEKYKQNIIFNFK